MAIATSSRANGSAVTRGNSYEAAAPGTGSKDDAAPPDDATRSVGTTRLGRALDDVAPEAVVRVGMTLIAGVLLAGSVAGEALLLGVGGNVIDVAGHHGGLGAQEVGGDRDRGDQRQNDDEDDADHARQYRAMRVLYYPAAS